MHVITPPMSHANILNRVLFKLMKVTRNALESVKGIGTVYAAGLIAEIGDMEGLHTTMPWLSTQA